MVRTLILGLFALTVLGLVLADDKDDKGGDSSPAGMGMSFGKGIPDLSKLFKSIGEMAKQFNSMKGQKGGKKPAHGSSENSNDKEDGDSKQSSYDYSKYMNHKSQDGNGDKSESMDDRALTEALDASDTSDLMDTLGGTDPRDMMMCPAGYTGHDSSCYKFFKAMAPHHKAKEMCKNEGAQLVTIESKQKQNELVQVAKKYMGEFNTVPPAALPYYNIGGMYNNPNGWQWGQSSQPFGYTNWFAGQPKAAECVAMYFHPKASYSDMGKWTSVPCARVAPFICEKRALSEQI